MSNISAISWREKVSFNEMMMMMVSDLYYINMLRWISIVLHVAHWNNIPQIDMSLHSNTLSWLPANMSHSQCDAQYQIYSVWFGPIGGGTNYLPNSRRAQSIWKCTKSLCILINSICI